MKHPNFELTIEIPGKVTARMLSCAKEILRDEHGVEIPLKQLASNVLLEAYFEGALTKSIEDYANEYIGVYDILNYTELSKIFKTEIAAHEEKEKAEQAKEKQMQLAAVKANKEEEERLRKEGHSLVVSFKDSNKAEAILRAAGITVKLL